MTHRSLSSEGSAGVSQALYCCQNVQRCVANYRQRDSLLKVWKIKHGIAPGLDYGSVIDPLYIVNFSVQALSPTCHQLLGRFPAFYYHCFFLSVSLWNPLLYPKFHSLTTISCCAFKGDRLFYRFFHAVEGHRRWLKVTKCLPSYFVNGLEGSLHFKFRLSWSSSCWKPGWVKFFLVEVVGF